MGSNEFEIAKDLVLVRLVALPNKNVPGPKRIADDLYPFFEEDVPRGAWNDLFETVVNDLKSSNLITTRPYCITEMGRGRALQYLEIESLPLGTMWPTIRDTFLVTKALGLSPSSSEARAGIKDADHLRGFVVKDEHCLAGPQFPTLRQAVHALAWRELGVQTCLPINEKNLTRFLLGENLEEPSRSNTDQLRVQLAAQAAKTTTTDAKELRWEVLRKLVSHRTERASLTVDNSLEEFSHQVAEAARNARSGRFGDHKVFISHIWGELREQPICQGLDFEGFKNRLAEANRAGLVALSRADLVGAMDPADVSASETSFLNATFHFVEI